MNKKKPFFQFYGTRSKFVYYNDLQNTYPDIYNKIISEKLSHTANHNSKMKNIAQNMFHMASIEGLKEIALLQKFFNVGNLGLNTNNMYSSDIGIKIVNAINTALQFKETYERHLTRIVGKNGEGKGHAKITAAQFFANYFSDNFYKIVSSTLNGIDPSQYTLEQLGEILFSDENINKALSQTFFESLKNSGDWSAKDDKHGYQELFSAIEKFNKEELLREVSQAYHLDELKSRLMKSLESTERAESIFSGRKSGRAYIKTSLKESTTAKGTLAEIMGEKGVSAIVSGLQSGGAKIRYASKVIGKAGGKADIVMTFNLDMSQIIDIVNKHYANREETVSAYKQLNNYLSKMNDGFVVYTNAKDYSLMKDSGKGGYFFQGFSAGAPISLGSLEGVIANTPGGSADIIGQIMSTMDGAIYSDRIDELEKELCSKMAYLLFDDVLTIGKTTPASGKAIHLLLLDGVYIPLSYLFFLMAQAIEEVTEDPDDILKVTISPGSIAFPNPPWGPGKWSEQKNIAYSQIKISAIFLRNFANIVSGLRQ